MSYFQNKKIKDCKKSSKEFLENNKIEVKAVKNKIDIYNNIGRIMTKFELLDDKEIRK